jgi:hypothetical protein
MLSEATQMRVAWRELGPGIANSDDGAAVKNVGRVALILHPAAMHKGILARATKPRSRSQLGFIGLHDLPLETLFCIAKQRLVLRY